MYESNMNQLKKFQSFKQRLQLGKYKFQIVQQWRAICETERALSSSSNNNKSLNSNILSSNSVNQQIAKSPNLYHKFKDGSWRIFTWNCDEEQRYTEQSKNVEERTNSCEADSLRQRTKDIYGEGRALETQR